MAEPRPEDVLRSAVQPLADMARSMSDAARSLAGGGGVSLESMQRWAEQLSSLPRQSVEVLRGIVEEQRQMAELMASWAEQHRELADKLASSAERLRQLSQSGSAVVDPLLEYAQRITEVTELWTRLLPPQSRD